MSSAFIERLVQNGGLVHRPSTLEAVRAVTERFALHYNQERPHQGRACGNVPPRVAFPRLPALPKLPTLVDPDCWLEKIDGQAFVRRVGSNGCVEVNHETYYMSRDQAKQQVAFFVNAVERVFEVYQGHQRLKVLPIKGLHGGTMPLEGYVALIQQEARSQERRALANKRPLGQLPLWG